MKLAREAKSIKFMIVTLTVNVNESYENRKLMRTY